MEKVGEDYRTWCPKAAGGYGLLLTGSPAALPSVTVSTPTGDPRQIKAAYRKGFDDTAPARRKWHSVLGPAMAPVSEMLLDLAGVTEGKWVLDVCCGLGDPALDAARRVGPQGRVTGVDQARRMLAIAEERARADGLENVGFQELDVEELVTWPEASYDAVVSRFGLSFIPQLSLTLRGIHRVLMRGGAVAAANWGPLEKVPFLAVSRGVVSEFVGRALPAPTLPGPFALAQPGLLEQTLSSAGFHDIRGERMTVVFELPSAEAYVQLTREATALGQLVAESSTVPADEVWAAVAEATKPYADAEGRLSFPCAATCVVATR